MSEKRNAVAFLVIKGEDGFWHRASTGERYAFFDDIPEGAIWDTARHGRRGGADGLSLHAKCPGGHLWHIDGRASNCTMPEDNEHRCWIRHGEPPMLTVDKNGVTCAAGAGSIDAPGWHGFLRNGVFEEC